MIYTHYDYLDLAPGASVARIEAAYAQVLQRFHFGRTETGQDLSGLVRMIHAAYRVLSDPEARRAYDEGSTHYVAGRYEDALIAFERAYSLRPNPVVLMPILECHDHLGHVPEAIRTGVRNNLGGHANHTMFWQIMGPGGGKAEGDVLAAIDRDLGGLEKMQNDFNGAGGRVFGSGWVFVTVDKDGKLAIETRPNQDNPLMDGKRALLGNDVWEHAYYLNYQNRRADYLKAWWNTVNWKVVGERYAAAKAGTLGV